MSTTAQQIAKAEKIAESLFVSPKGVVNVSDHEFRLTPQDGWEGACPPKLTTKDKRGVHEQTDEEVWKDLMVPLYRGVVEESDVSPTSQDGPQLGGLADGFTLMQGMGRLLTTPTKVDGDEQPGLTQLEAARIIQGWLLGE